MPTTYPLDLTGNAGTNLITNELHTFNTAADRIFPLTAGPFYTIGLEVYHGVTNQLLQPITQYKALHLHRDASLVSGKEVCAVIIVEDATIPSVRVKYHCIGGLYSNEASLIQDLIDNNPIANDDVVWGQIIGIPVQFPPTEHLHHFDNIYGAEEMVAVLERIRMAIAAGDSPAIAAIYHYIHTLLTNLDYQTEQQVIDLIGTGSAQHTTTYKTYALLREETNLINNESYLYVATGKNAVNDRKAKIFMWDITCTIADDNEDIIRPNHIPVGNPGRFVSALIIESKFKRLAASVGRTFDAEGNLLSSFNSTGRIFDGDLNTLVEQGPWLFTATSTNRPTRMTFLSSDPIAIGEGYIIVTKLDGKVIQEVLMPGLDVSPKGEFIAQSFKRTGLETAPGSSTYTWSRWDAAASQSTLARYGIDRAIAAENTLSSISDLDNVVVPGKYWFEDTQDNRPFDWGILEVELVGGSIVTPVEIYQKAYWDGRKASRSRNYLGVWSRWSFTQNLDIDTEANISGQNLDSVLWPGIYYYNTTCSNTPSNYGILEVRRENTHIVYQEAHGSNNEKYSRYRYSNGIWTAWECSAKVSTLARYGIEAPIATYNTLPVNTDADTVTRPGKYFTTDTTTNVPGAWGILEVELISGDLVTAQEIEQSFKQSFGVNGTDPNATSIVATRRRFWDSVNYVWTPWRRIAGRNGDYTQTFAMYSPDINTIDPSHGVNAAFLATQFATLWARLTANGIDATIGATNFLPAYTDLDGVITVGKYWVGHSSGYYNSPFDFGILEVEKIDANNIIQTMYDELRRTSRRTDSAGTWWTEWTFSQNLNIAYESSRANRDLDWTLTPGEYYYTPTTISRPTPYGLVKVWRENNDIVYQQAHGSDNTFHTRYRDGLGVWTPWARLLSTNDSFIDNVGNGLGYFTPLGVSTYNMTLPGNATIRVYLVGGGGGGGGYTGAASTGRDGQDSYFIADGNEIARAYGGKGGFPGYGAGASKYDIDPPPRTSWLFSRWSLDKTSILTMNGSKDGVHGFDRFHTALSDGFGVGGQPNPAFPDNWRRASVGGQSGHIEVLYKNPGALPISFTIVIGDGGAGGDAWATKGGEGRGLILIN